jgi:metal-dependent hydrolase (beta-lactamase superfamily II)
MGNFYLWQAEDSVIEKTAQWLKQKGLKKFVGGHCTDIRAANKISDIVGIDRKNHSHNALGNIFTRNLETIRSSVE